MNDFTKEELEHIQVMLNYTRDEQGHDDDLINKVQSLIDNYCEHEFYNTSFYYEKCIKCGVIQ